MGTIEKLEAALAAKRTAQAALDASGGFDEALVEASCAADREHDALLFAAEPALLAVAKAARGVVRQQLGDNLDNWTDDERHHSSRANRVTRAAFETADALEALDALELT